MADVPYARWYDEGTAAFVKGSTTVTGTNTFWISAGIKAGDIFIDPTGKIYEIASVDSSTQITLRKTYAGETGTGKSYSIIRTYTSSVTAELASKMSTLLNEFERRYNLDMQTITGKSAYDIAKDNGFSGTQEEWLTSLSAYGVAIKNGYEGTQPEWLESLKADNEWSTLDARTQILTNDTIGYKNSVYRGQYLGNAVTDAQYEAIQAKNYADFYIGDYWQIGDATFIIAGFTECVYNVTQSTGDMGMIMLLRWGGSPMNDTNDMTGGFKNTTMWNETIPSIVEGIITPRFRNLAIPHYEWLDQGFSEGRLGAWNNVVSNKIANLVRYENLFGYLWPYYNTNAYQPHKKAFPVCQFNLEQVLSGSATPYWTATRYNAERWVMVMSKFGHCNWYAETGLPTVNGAIILYFYV